MRTIKFRVWDGYDMVEDVTVGKHGAFWTSGISESDNQSLGNTTKYDCYLAVMQFTGLHDKNGKEIYEGDILGDWVDVDGKTEQSRQAVFFHEQEGQWVLDNSFHQDRSHFFSLAGELKDFEYEIIGNIYENPELLTTKK